MDVNYYPRRPFSLTHEEKNFHKRNPETGIIVGAEPFFFQGTNPSAVLMLHGYTSSPRDLKELGQALSRFHGFTVSGILLPGHGKKPTDLDRVTWPDWYAAAEAEFDRLKSRFPVVHVVGFSMGAALALHLAARRPVGRLVLLSPFFKIAYNRYHLVPEEWLVYTIGHLLRHLKKRHSGNCNHPEERRRHIAYYHYALSSIHQSLALVREIRREIPSIMNPLLIIHSKGDQTTSPSASRRIYDQIPSVQKRFVWLRKSNHIITHDYDKPLVFKETLSFLAP